MSALVQPNQITGKYSASDRTNTFVAGISFKTAPVELRERLAVSPARLRCTACQLKVQAGLSEVVVLSTCNRVEIYGAGSRKYGADDIFRVIARSPVDVDQHAYLFENADAARHLFAVAGGLDSMVLGETEITGQVKHAYQAAHEFGLTGRTTNCLFQKALQTAKDIRSRTQLGRGATSVGSVAVQLAEKLFGNRFGEKSVMIVGAGKMGEACIRHLAKKGVKSVIVANRSPHRALELAGQFGGKAVSMEDSLDVMSEADIVVTSTGSPGIVFNKADIAAVMKRRANRPLFLIDIAVPRDVDPRVHDLENVYLYNVDNLQDLVRENVRLREQEVNRCSAIIETKSAELFAKLNSALPGKSVRAERETNWAEERYGLCPA